MSRTLPSIEDILRRPERVPSDLRDWIRTYHTGDPYSSRPLGVRDPEISRFLMYYAVYAKIFLRPDQAAYDLPVVNLERPPSKREFLRILRNEGHVCGSGTYRENGLLDGVGSALQDLGSAISSFAGSVLDFFPSSDEIVELANRQVEEWLLDGTAARALGGLLALTPCSAICVGIGEVIAQAQGWLDDKDYFGEKPSDFVNIAYFFDDDKSRPKPPNLGPYEFFCWRLPGNFTFGLSTARPFERIELQMLVNTASFLAPFFQEVVARDNIPAPLDIVVSAVFRKTLDLSQSLSTLELMRLFFSMKALVKRNVFRQVSKSGIPFYIVPEVNALIERPQLEALLLIARQSSSAVSMFANITGDPTLLRMASHYIRDFPSQRTAYLQFTKALDADLRALTSRIVDGDIDVSKRGALPLPAVATLAAGVAGGLIYGIAKWSGRV